MYCLARAVLSAEETCPGRHRRVRTLRTALGYLGLPRCNQDYIHKVFRRLVRLSYSSNHYRGHHSDAKPPQLSSKPQQVQQLQNLKPKPCPLNPDPEPSTLLNPKSLKLSESFQQTGPLDSAARPTVVAPPRSWQKSLRSSGKFVTYIQTP